MLPLGPPGVQVCRCRRVSASDHDRSWTCRSRGSGEFQKFEPVSSKFETGRCRLAFTACVLVQSLRLLLHTCCVLPRPTLMTRFKTSSSTPQWHRHGDTSARRRRRGATGHGRPASRDPAVLAPAVHPPPPTAGGWPYSSARHALLPLQSGTSTATAALRPARAHARREGTGRGVGSYA
jgi:hypothetical protein